MYGYHYDSETGRRVINGEQAAVVRRVFEDFAGGASILGITNGLNEAGTLSFTGRAWSAWTVKNMLRNPGYAGRTIFKRTKSGHRRDPLTGKRRRTVALRDESEWIEVPDATPPIISEELFNAVQTRLLDPERRRQAQRKNDYPLGGFMRCARCNGAMVGQTSTGKYRYYRCRRAYAGPRHDRCPTRYVRAADLERAVARELTTALASPEVVLAELEHASSDDARDDDLAAAQQLLASLDNQRQRVLKLFQMGEVDEAYLQKELESIRGRRFPAEATIARLNGSGSSPRTPANPEEFAATCEALRERVVDEIEAGRLKSVAEAMQISVTIEKTDDGALGVLEGVIPHEIGRFGEDFSHHCTNMGLTVQKRQDREGAGSGSDAVGAVNPDTRRAELEVTFPRA